MVLQTEYSSNGRRMLAATLITLWELVDSLRPPWLQFMGCATALIWANAVFSGWYAFVSQGNHSELYLLEFILGSYEWAGVSIAMSLLSGYAFFHPDKRSLRRWVLLVFSIYSMVPAVVLGLVIPGTPMGQVSLLLSILCFVAFLRPLVLHGLEHLKEKTDEPRG